jgi:hypothetical protein
MLRRRLRLPAVPSPPAPAQRRAFRSEAALEAIRSHSLALKAAAAASSSDADDQAGPASLALYNYPTFAGAYGALAARLFHQRVRRRILVLPFSSVEPFRFLLTRISPFRIPSAPSGVNQRVRLFLPWRRVLLKRIGPIRAEDFKDAGFQTCYLLDFIGPKKFAFELSQFVPRCVSKEAKRMSKEAKMTSCSRNGSLDDAFLCRDESFE